jgi:hypothetical protein
MKSGGQQRHVGKGLAQANSPNIVVTLIRRAVALDADRI